MTRRERNHPIKISHITTTDISLHLLLFNQIKAIQAAGFDVAGISSPGPDVPHLQQNNIPHISVPITRTITPFKDLLALWRLYRLFKQEQYTIVHTHTPKPGLLAQVAARLAGTPIIINTLHGFYFHAETPYRIRQFYIFLEKIAALCSDAILSQNPEDIQTAIKENICRPEQISWLGNGIDVERFDRAKISEQTRQELSLELGIDLNRPVIGFVGRLVAEKGILELLEATRSIIKTHPDIQLLIIGPYDQEKADAIHPNIAQAYGLEKHCVFTGRRQDMPELYSLMDIFVLPSHREGFPRSPMEASAMGVPSIATNIRGCRESVKDGINGFLCHQDPLPG